MDTTSQNKSGLHKALRSLGPASTQLLEEGSAVARLSVDVDASNSPNAKSPSNPERVRVVVIGGGQAGLAIGYHLSRRDVPFVILDAGARVGDRWRQRWDSLRLFTPARFDSLDGMKFPDRPNVFPTRNQMADYLEQYATRFDLPVRSEVRVDRLSRHQGRFAISAGGRRYEADQVVVAMGLYQVPRVPTFASDLDSSIVQMHSIDYRNPSQLAAGETLIVGAGNSGAEIAMDLVRSGRTVRLSGRFTGQIPFRIERGLGRLLARVVLRGLFHHVATLRTPIGRKMRTQMMSGGGDTLIRVKRRDLEAAVLEWMPRIAGVRDGLPALSDGRVIDVKNVVWCTGFDPGLSWIDLPVFGADGDPIQRRGVSAEGGLYFLGHHFLYAASSGMVQGVSRDAEHIAAHIARIGSN